MQVLRTAPARRLQTVAGMTDNTLEARVRELESEVETLRRKVERLEETVSHLFAELRSTEEAVDFSG